LPLEFTPPVRIPLSNVSTLTPVPRPVHQTYQVKKSA
jgi:hypothetical protein